MFKRRHVERKLDEGYVICYNESYIDRNNKLNSTLNSADLQ